MEPTISPAIIMRTRELGESDLLVNFFTRDMGLLRGIAKGAKRSKHRFSNCLDLFCLASVEYGKKRVQNLYMLNSCKLIDSFFGLRSDFSALCLASYMVELTEVLFPAQISESRIFDLLKDSLSALDRGVEPGRLRLFFEARAMALGGYEIELSKCCDCGRSYRGEGRAVINREKGGLSCLGCRKESVSFPGMDPSSVKILKTLACNGEGLPDLEALSSENTKEIACALRIHIDYWLGRRLKTSRYMDEF